MIEKKKRKREKGINIAVSPQAHRKMARDIISSKPKVDLRGKINQLNGLAPEL